MSAFAQMHGAVGVGSSAVLGIGLFSIHRCLSLKAPTAAARQRRANADGSGAGLIAVSVTVPSSTENRCSESQAHTLTSNESPTCQLPMVASSGSDMPIMIFSLAFPPRTVP